MLHKTHGIVLHTTKYTDNSIVAKIYTELFGLQTFLISGARGKKSSVKANLFQPLALVDIVIYHKENKQLQRIKEVRIESPFVSIPYSLSKASIVLFLNEILYKTIREEEPDANLFEFIYKSLQILDLKKDNWVNFHLLFLVQLSKYLGFYPQGRFSETTNYFDLKEGKFMEKQSLYPHFLSPLLSNLLSQLLGSTYDTLPNNSISNTARRELLEQLIIYYQLHGTGIYEIKSHHVLEEVIIKD